MADLGWLRERGLADAITSLAENGTEVIGICGGYQMLGQSLEDPGKVESHHALAEGLGLLPVISRFNSGKTTHRVSARIETGPGWLNHLIGSQITGYEIHMAQTEVDEPWLRIGERSGRACDVWDGAVNKPGNVWGCYIHGLFENALFRQAWLAHLAGSPASSSQHDGGPSVLASLDRVADELEHRLDMEALASDLACSPTALRISHD